MKPQIIHCFKIYRKVKHCQLLHSEQFFLFHRLYNLQTLSLFCKILLDMRNTRHQYVQHCKLLQKKYSSINKPAKHLNLSQTHRLNGRHQCASTGNKPNSILLNTIYIPLTTKSGQQNFQERNKIAVMWRIIINLSFYQ